MKRYSVVVVLMLLVGCAANQPKSGIFKHLSDGSTVPLQMAIDAGEDVNQVDHEGQTILHLALRFSPHLVPVILNSSADLNAQDSSGRTPLHIAVLYSSKWIIPLLEKGADSTLRTTQAVNCFIRKGSNNSSIAFNTETPLELATTCYKADAIAEFDRFARDTSAWSVAKSANTESSFKFYLGSFKKPLFASEARRIMDELHQAHLAELEGKKKCELNEAGWYFIKGSCKSGLASGKGISVSASGDRFEGDFADGRRINGALIEEDRVTYDGEFTDGLPHGYGICLYEDAFEECRLYKGKRIDTLYKQRETIGKQLEQISRQLTGLNRTVASSRQSSRASSASKYEYIGDLNSKNDFRRTTAQIQAAMDLFQLLSDK